MIPFYIDEDHAQKENKIIDLWMCRSKTIYNVVLHQFSTFLWFPMLQLVVPKWAYAWYYEGII